jgi:hypothetical protein
MSQCFAWSSCFTLQNELAMPLTLYLLASLMSRGDVGTWGNTHMKKGSMYLLTLLFGHIPSGTEREPLYAQHILEWIHPCSCLLTCLDALNSLETVLISFLTIITLSCNYSRCWGHFDLVYCNCMQIRMHDGDNHITCSSIEESINGDQHCSWILAQAQSEDMKVVTGMYGDAVVLPESYDK